MQSPDRHAVDRSRAAWAALGDRLRTVTPAALGRAALVAAVAGAIILATLATWPTLLPFVVGIALAYILNPAVVLVERSGVSRAWSAAIVLLAVLSVIIGLLVVVTPLIATQIVGLLARPPGYVGDLNNLVRTLAPQLNEWLGPERAAQLQTQLTQVIGSSVAWLRKGVP